MAKGIGRNGELFKELCDPAHLIRSAVAAARFKRKKPEVARFLLELEPHCFRLAETIAAGQWHPGPYHTFHIKEPKPRMISAAPFADRVVHHALVSLLEPHFERRFVAHSYACRVGKGTHRAITRASRLMRTRPFVLKGDVQKFFPSIDHEILKGEVRRVISDERLLDVLFRVVDGSNQQESVQEWYEGDDLFAPVRRRVGLPIGNLTSQFLANVFMDRFDHTVMDRMRCGEYVRYCDDFLVFGESKAQLWEIRGEIARVLAEMRLRLHPRKGGVHATSTVIPFLGLTLRRGIRRLQRAGVVRATRRLRRVREQIDAQELSVKDVQSRVASWVGHASHASSPRVIEAVLARAGLAYACRGFTPTTMRTVCCAAATGTTTPTTAVRRTATTTTPITPTTTLAFGSRALSASNCCK